MNKQPPTNAPTPPNNAAKPTKPGLVARRGRRPEDEQLLDEAAEMSSDEVQNQDEFNPADLELVTAESTPAEATPADPAGAAAAPWTARYAQAATTVVTDAVAGTTTTAGTVAGISTGLLVGLGVVTVAAAAGGGGGGSSSGDTTAPSAPVIAVVGGNDIVTAAEKTAGVTVSGTAEALSTVTVTWGGTSKTATADALGAYSTSFASGEIPADGATTITATARDAAGNTSTAASRPVTVNTSSNNLPVADGYIRDAAIWVDTDNDGREDYNTGRTTDAQGNFVLDADVPAGTLFAIGGVNIDTGIPNTMVLKAPSGSTVINPLTTLLHNYIESSPTPVTPQAASAALAAALGLDNGTNLASFDPLAATGANALQGQRAAAQIATLLTQGAGNDNAAGNTILNNLAGIVRNAPAATLDLGDLATLNSALNGITPSTPANTIQNNTSAIQNAGDFTAIAQAQSLALDTTAPTAPLLLLNTPGNDATPNVRVEFNTTALNGTAAVAGNTVRVLEGNTELGSAILNNIDISRGYVEIALSTLSNLGAEGIHTLLARLTDGARLSTDSAPVTHTLDTTLPVIAITQVATDDLVNSTERGAGAVVSGTTDAENGREVSLLEGNTVVATGLVHNGTWSATLRQENLAEGSHTITARVNDLAGNSATSAGHNFAVDTAIPNLTITSATSTADSSPVITGTADAGLTITVVVGAATYTTVATGGVWSIDTGSATPTSGTFSALSHGIHAVSASTLDAAGNPRQVGQTLLMDPSLAPPAVVPNVVSVVVSGTTGAVNDNLNAGDSVSFAVTFSKNTLVTGTPRLVVQIGTDTVYANYVSGSGTTSLIFTTTIQAGQNSDASGIQVGANALQRNGGTLLDSDGNAATLSHGTMTGQTIYVVDTTAPVFTSGNTPGVTENHTITLPALDASLQGGEAGVTYSLSGPDAAMFTLYTGTGQILFKASPDYEAPADADANNIYDVTLRATDYAGNFTDEALAISVTDDPNDGLAIQTSIDLGAYGTLIQPYQYDSDGDGVVDKILYHWDRSGDGTSANTGSLNGGLDTVTYETLATLFLQDSNGNLNSGTQINDTYRYATLNGVQVALPVAGRPVDQTLLDNQAYTGLAEFWDTYNSGYMTSGQPAGWATSYYWTSTPSGNTKHGSLFLANGQLLFQWDSSQTGYMVALEVFGVPLDTSNPVFTSGAQASIMENTNGTAYDATANGDTGITYPLAGTDAAKFNINASTGVVSFKAPANYEAPGDSGADNIYDISVKATELGGNNTTQAVQITVTNDAADDNLAPVIDLGTMGKLIAPVLVDGKTYYYWDRSGDGTSADTGSLNGGSDMLSMNAIANIFNKNAAGVAETYATRVGSYDKPDDTFRFGTINGVDVALPTLGTSFNFAALQDEQPYAGMAEIWDSHNSGANTSGIPTDWAAGVAMYWTATDISGSHALVQLSIGSMTGQPDNLTYYVALQVL